MKQTVTLSRGQPLEFHRPDGSRILVEPLTWGAWAQIVALDPEPSEEQNILRLAEIAARRLEIVLEHARCTDPAGNPQACREVIDSLTAQERHEMWAAILANETGLTHPAVAAEVQSAMHAVIKKNVEPDRKGNSSKSTNGKR